MTNNVRADARPPRLLLICALLVVPFAACGGGDANNAPQSNASASSNNSSAAGNTTTVGGGDAKNYDAEIERLEKEAGKNPGNADTLAQLARAYVRRGNALRDAGRLREAMDDYRRAQRRDPDNEEAQRNAADIAPQVEGTPTGEYGEPAPLPISPNVAGDEAKPTPTPKKQ